MFPASVQRCATMSYLGDSCTCRLIQSKTAIVRASHPPNYFNRNLHAFRFTRHEGQHSEQCTTCSTRCHTFRRGRWTPRSDLAPRMSQWLSTPLLGSVGGSSCLRHLGFERRVTPLVLVGVSCSSYSHRAGRVIDTLDSRAQMSKYWLPLSQAAPVTTKPSDACAYSTQVTSSVRTC